MTNLPISTQSRVASFRPARWTYFVLCLLLVVCIVVQVFLAGMGALVDPRYFVMHKAFGDWFGLLLLPMLGAALLGRLPRPVTFATLGLLLLYWLQYVFFQLGASAAFLRAFHVVNALLIFWSAARLAQAALSSLRTGPNR